MSARRGLRRRVLLVAVAGLALIATAAPTSPAGILSPACPSPVLEQPFLPWLDPAYYTLAPNGGFEETDPAWTLTGSAAVVSGNESYHVRQPTDTRSLSLPAGSSARAPAVCVSSLDSTLRLFVRNTGSLLSRLSVDVSYTNITGGTTTVTVASLTATSDWQPSLPIALLANLEVPPLVTDGNVAVSLRFRPQGSAGAWRIDDVYVDPFKGV